MPSAVLIPLSTSGEYVLVDLVDAKWVNEYRCNLGSHGYAVRHRKLLHRALAERWGWDLSGKNMVDHRNRNKLDCRQANLRVCTRSQNNGNKRRNLNNTSGIKGVHWHEGGQKWMAIIEFQGRRRYLGLFAQKEDAAAAYAKAAQELFGQFALADRADR